VHEDVLNNTRYGIEKNFGKKGESEHLDPYQLTNMQAERKNGTGFNIDTGLDELKN
jgi:hypothetical protein